MVEATSRCCKLLIEGCRNTGSSKRALRKSKRGLWKFRLRTYYIVQGLADTMGPSLIVPMFLEKRNWALVPTSPSPSNSIPFTMWGCNNPSDLRASRNISQIYQGKEHRSESEASFWKCSPRSGQRCVLTGKPYTDQHPHEQVMSLSLDAWKPSVDPCNKTDDFHSLPHFIYCSIYCVGGKATGNWGLKWCTSFSAYCLPTHFLPIC